jgi:hypothetical protein
MRTIEQIIKEDMTKNDYIKKELKSFNLSAYINKLIDVISEENSVKKSLVMTILIENGIKNLSKEDLEEVIKNNFVK